MLVWNVNTPDGLVNGAMGTVIDIVKNPKGQVNCIIVSFDSESAGEMVHEKYPNIKSRYRARNGTPMFRVETD